MYSGVLLEKRATSTPQPIAVSPSQMWEGNDGSWSTFVIRVGTPAQTFRVQVSTSGQETWVPLVDACYPPSSFPANCSTIRGIQDFQNAPSTGFKTNQSSTWNFVNLYKLAAEESLAPNYAGNGMYGLETIGLQIQNSGGSTLNRQVLAAIVTQNFMFGMFGLGPKGTNFSDFNDPQPSYLWSLRNQSMIPSLSYSYSAGAFYQKSIGSAALGTLIFGGYDASQFKSDSPAISFNIDSFSNMEVGLQVIQASNTLAGTVSLLNTGIMTNFDSTIPEIWLPIDVCGGFEKAFGEIASSVFAIYQSSPPLFLSIGLQYDNSTDRYLVNETIHSQLQQLNPTITFKLGNTTYGGQAVNIVFPYAAFDLQLGYPIYPSVERYFPIRRAQNDSQYIIGRTFMQEAYFVVDYERSNYSIHQRIFSRATSPAIIPIESTDLPEKQHSGLSRGAIAGIVVAAVVAFSCLIGILYFGYRKHKQKSRKLSSKTSPRAAKSAIVSSGTDPAVSTPNGVEWPHDVLMEIEGRTFAHEVEGVQMYSEIGGREVVPELPGAESQSRMRSK